MTILSNKPFASNPYAQLGEPERVAKSLVNLSKGEFYYVNPATLEVERTHVFRRMYEWVKGFFGGNDMCNQKLASICLMREVSLLANAGPLEESTISAIKTIVHKLGLTSHVEPLTQEPFQFFQAIFDHQLPEHLLVEREIYSYYQINQNELSKYTAEKKVDDFFKSTLSVEMSSTTNTLPLDIPNNKTQKHEEDEKSDSSLKNRDSSPSDAEVGEELQEFENQDNFLQSEVEAQTGDAEPQLDTQLEEKSIQEEINEASVEQAHFVPSQSLFKKEDVLPSEAEVEEELQEFENQDNFLQSEAETHTGDAEPQLDTQPEEKSIQEEIDEDSVEQEYLLPTESLKFIRDQDVLYSEEEIVSSEKSVTTTDPLSTDTSEKKKSSKLSKHVVKPLPPSHHVTEESSSYAPSALLGVAAVVGAFAIGHHLGFVTPSIPTFDLTTSTISPIQSTNPIATPSTNPGADFKGVANLINYVKESIAHTFWGSATQQETLDPPIPVQQDPNLLPVDPKTALLKEQFSLLQWKTLDDSPSLPIDDKLFQHILGSYFGKGTGFEGNDPRHVLNYLITLSRHKIESLSKDRLCDENSKLEFCQTVSGQNDPESALKLFTAMKEQMDKAFQLTKIAFADNTQNFAAAFRTQVDTLNAGNTFFLDGGWSQISSGHSVVLEVIKQSDGHFTFRVYNRGSGLEYYANAEIKEKEHFLPFIEIVDVPYDRLTSPTFLKSLHEMNSSPVKGLAWNAEDLIARILPILGGKHSHHSYPVDQAQERLQVGHCTYLSLTAWMSQQLGNKQAYSRWQLEVEFKALSDYFKQHQQRLPAEEPVRRLMREGVSQFSRNAILANKEGIITDPDLAWLQQQIALIDQRLIEANLDYNTQVTANTPVAEIVAIRSNWSKSAVKYFMFESLDIENSDKRSLTHNPLGLSQFEYHPAKLSQDLTNLRDAILNLKKEKRLDVYNHLKIKESIEILIDTIPLAGNCFWKTLTLAENREIIPLLTSLSELHLSSALDIHKHDGKQTTTLSIDNFLMQVKILTLIDASTRHFKTELGFEFPCTIQEDALAILNGAYSFIGVDNPLKNDDLRLMLQYWNAMPPIPRPAYENDKSFDYSFFGLHQDKELHLNVYETDETKDKYYHIPALDFAENWLKNHPEVENDFDEKHPNLKDIRLRVKAFITLGTLHYEKNPTELLPLEFYALRNISNLMNFVVNAKLDRFEHYDRTFLVSPSYSFSGTIWKLLPSMHTWDGLKLRMDDPRNLAEAKIGSLSLLLTEKNVVRQRLSPHVRLLQADIKEASKTSIDLDEEQEILALSSRKNLQIDQTLGYFYKYRERLSNPHYQKLFKFLMTENGLLTDAFLRSPRYAQELSQSLGNLIKQQYTLYKDLDDVSARLSMIELNNFLNSIILYTMEKYPQAFPADFKNPFLDFSQDLNAIIANPSVDNNRSYACFLKVQSFSAKTKLERNEAIDLLTAIIQWKSFPLPKADERWENTQEIQIRDLTYKLQGPLLEVLKGENVPFILNAVVKKFDPDFINQKWTTDSSLTEYRTNNNKIFINILDGVLLFENHGTMLLPSEIKSHPYLAPLFAPEDNVMAKQNMDHSFEFKDKKGNPCRAIKTSLKYLNGLLIGRKLGDRWYQAFDPKLFLENFPFESLKENTYVWSADANMFISDVNDVFKYRIEMSRYKIKDIHRLDVNGQDTGEVLADIYSEPTAYSFLERIENKQHIGVWNNQETGNPVLIELPRLGLEFNVVNINGEFRAYCKQLPEYYIVSNQNVKELGDITSYLLLQKENAKGKTKQVVIMPRLQMQRLANSLETVTVPDFTTNKPYTLYDVDQKTQLLKPRNTEARFYLSMMFLWERDYSKAMSYLQGYGTQLKRLTAEDHQMLEWILTLDAMNNDNTPQAYSIKAYTHFLKIRDLVDFSKTSDLDPGYLEKVIEDFENYIQVKDQMGVLQLKPEEELFLIKSILNAASTTKKIENKIQSLFRRVNPQEFKKQFPDASISMPSSLLSGMKKVQFTLDPTKVLASEIREAFTEYKKIDTQESSSILRNPFTKPLITLLHKKIENKQYDEIPGILVESLLENEVDKIPAEQMKDEANRLLWIIRSSRAAEVQKMIAGYLGRLLENPTDDLWNLVCAPVVEETPKLDMQATRLIISWNPNISTASASTGFFDKDPIQLDPVFTQAQAPYDKKFLTSIQQKDLSSFKKPAVENIQTYVTTLPVSPKNLEQEAEISQNLQNIFNIITGDNVANRKFQELREEIHTFGAKHKGIKETYTLNDLGKLQNLKETLQKSVAEQTEVLEFKEKGIQELANKPFDDPLLEAKKQVRLSGGLESPVNMSELIHLFRFCDRKKYHERAQALSVKEIDILHKELRDYLVLATFTQQQQRVINKISEIEKAQEGNASQAEQEELLREFVSLAQATRNYEIHEHPEYLPLEYQANILIRSSQVANQLLISDYRKREGSDQYDGAAVEAIPGSGKTSVHVTLQALKDANGENLAVIVMPERLMPEMADELQQRLGNTYNQLVEIMSFDRDDTFDTVRLERILDKLDQIIKEQKALLITDNSVQSLFLKFIEKTLTTSNLKEISIFREILTLLRKRGTLTLDEMHAILNVLKAHHFTLGLPSPINNEVILASTDFYLIISTHPEIQKKINFNFLSNQEGSPFDPDKYKTDIQPIIIEAILNGEVGKADKEIRTFFQNLKAEEKELLSAYLANTENAEASTYVDNLPTMKIKNTLAVLKEQTSRILPLTAKKEHGKHYGEIPEETKNIRKDTELAIPYHGSKNPMLKSQFGTVLETIHYTIQMHLNKGISENIIQKEVQRISEKIKEEISKQTINKVEDSLLYQEFVRLCGSKDLPLFNLSKDDMLTIRNHVNSSPKLQIELITRYALSQVENYTHQLHSNGQIYASLFNLSRGFSGTLWNVEAYPNAFYEVFSSDAVAQTLFILAENKDTKIEVVHLPQVSLQGDPGTGDSPKNLVESIYGVTNQTKGSFIDSADLFSQLVTDHSEPNEVIAKHMLNYLPPSKKGMGYFTSKDKINVIMRNQESGVPIGQCGLSNEEIDMYFDFQHSFGADVPLSPTATGTVSFGQHTLLYALVQGVWRERRLGKGQTVNFVVSSEDEQIIRDTLKKITSKEVGKDLTLEDLVVYAMYNQAIRQGDDNYRSLKQKMDSLLITKIMEIIVDPSVDTADMIDIINQTKNLFVSTSSNNPYEQYGRATNYSPNKEVIEKDAKQFMNSDPIKAFKTHPLLKERYQIQAIESDLKQLIAKEIEKLPHQLLTSTQYDQEVTTTLAVEMNTKTESQMETQIEVESDSSSQKYTRAPPILKWNNEIIFQRNMLHPTPYYELTRTSLSLWELTKQRMYEGIYNENYAPEKNNRHTRELSFEMNQLLSNHQTPTLQISDVLGSEATTKEYAHVFDPDLLATLNMIPVYGQGWTDVLNDWPIYQPFSKYEEVTSPYVLVVQDIQTKQKKIIILDQEDAGQLADLLKSDRDNPLKDNREVHLGLYNLATEKLLETSLENFADEALQDQHSRDLLVQAKFFKGFLSYSKKEKEVLRKWIEEKDPQHMKKFFLNMVLNNKPSAKINFPGSDISKLFDEFDL